MTGRRREPGLASVRRQAALARALLDELEEVGPGCDPGSAFSAQAIEELARLGCRIFETVALLVLEEGANWGPRPGLGAQVEGERVGEGSASYVYAAVEGDRR
jgi:hypothetical protein